MHKVDMPQRRDFCRMIPKLELHAHLNGSISTETLTKLSAKRANSREKTDNHEKLEKWKRVAAGRERRSIEECFEIFPLITSLVDNVEAVAIATRDVIQEFAADNVKYLEIRSSPKEKASTGLSYRSYIETVLNEIKKCNSENLGIITRFILSIDRKVSLPAMGEIVKLAEEYRSSSDGLLLGIDLSGDPFSTNIAEVIPLLSKAKNSGLKLSLHIAELPNKSEESHLLLQVPPDRIGHGTFIHPRTGGTDEMERLVASSRIPIECCLTSNLIGGTITSYADSHFKYWYDKMHPAVLCTDDKGVFSTTLSEEYRIAAETWGLTEGDLWEITTQSIDYIFADRSVKDSLRDIWTNCRKEWTE